MFVVNRADNGQFVGLLGKPGQQFRDLNARYIGGDRLERPAHRIGSVRLQVPEVDMARRSAIEDENNRLRLALAFRSAGIGRAQPVGPKEAHGAHAAHCEELAACRAGTGAIRGWVRDSHGFAQELGFRRDLNAICGNVGGQGISSQSLTDRALSVNLPISLKFVSFRPSDPVAQLALGHPANLILRIKVVIQRVQLQKHESF